MRDWEKSCVTSDMSLVQVLRVINDSSMQLALVVDDSGRLLGLVTDGDMRRALLRGAGMSDAVSTFMNPNPLVFHGNQKKSYVIRQMQRLELRQAPIVDDDNIVVGFYELQELLTKKERTNPVIIMAGGLGTRLRPLTDECPKPLLKVGNKPILETILESFIENGFSRFYFSVNYRSEMIEEHFGDGSRFGVDITYIHENERMGTAGALSLLPEKFKEAAIVMNGDILTKMDFGEFIDFHERQNSAATMAAREMSYQIPYGVVRYEGEDMTGIVEKPSHTFYVNAGMYVLSPEAISRVDKKAFLDMPDLFTKLIQEELAVKIYPVCEYWMDIGKMDDFRQAQIDYPGIFDV